MCEKNRYNTLTNSTFHCEEGERHELLVRPLGTNVALDMLNVVSDPSDHEVFFDNFFAPRANFDNFFRSETSEGSARQERQEKAGRTNVL